MLLRISASKQQGLSSKPRQSKVRLLLCLMPFLSLWLISGYQQIQSYFIQPEAILVLGGEEERELFAAKFAQQHPKLDIWVSSGSPEWYTNRVFTKAGIKKDRLHIDRQATDTVTNFTTLVDKLQAQGIDGVYLITSDDHMPRARVIGEIVFGSRGILLKPVPVKLGRKPEPIEKCFRDGARSLLWVTTGYTGATLGQSSGGFHKK